MVSRPVQHQQAIAAHLQTPPKSFAPHLNAVAASNDDTRDVILLTPAAFNDDYAPARSRLAGASGSKPSAGVRFASSAAPASGPGSHAERANLEEMQTAADIRLRSEVESASRKSLQSPPLGEIQGLSFASAENNPALEQSKGTPATTQSTPGSVIFIIYKIYAN